MKRVVLIIALALFAGAMAFASGNTESSSSPQKITLKVGYWPQESDTAAVQVMEGYKKAFEAKYPNITVQPVVYHYGVDTFLPMAAAGQVPTIFETWFTEPQKLVDAGYAGDITQALKAAGLEQYMDPGIKKQLTFAGKIYGIPRDAYALGLYLDMKLFKQAGLVDAQGLPLYPKTYDDLITVAKTIKDKTGKAGFYMPTKDNNGGWIFTNIAWNFGASFEVQKNGKWMANLNSPEVIAAMQYIKDLKWKYDVLLPSTLLGWSEWIQNYGTYNVGMVTAAPDVINLPISDYKMNKDDISIVPVPAGPGGKQYSLLGGTIYMFGNTASEAEKEAAVSWLSETGRLPILTADGLKAREDDLATRAASGQPIGPQSLPVWNKPDYTDSINKLYDKYQNVNMNLFKAYYSNVSSTLRPEEPYFTQDLYHTLDGVIQAVMNDKGADVTKLLNDANALFQKTYMDTLK